MGPYGSIWFHFMHSQALKAYNRVIPTLHYAAAGVHLEPCWTTRSWTTSGQLRSAESISHTHTYYIKTMAVPYCCIAELARERH